MESFKEAHKFQLSYNALNDVRILEKKFQEVKKFEMAQMKSVCIIVNPIN